MFAALDTICKPSCIFTSNTSGFVIEEVAAKCSVRPMPSPSKPCAQPEPLCFSVLWFRPPSADNGQAALTCRACGCCAQDERKKIFGGMHYSNPVPVMTMLEVIYTEETSQEAVDIMCTVGEAQDKAISLVRDMPGTYGFILNRVFAAAAREGAPPSPARAKVSTCRAV